MANPVLGPKWFNMRDNLWGAQESHGIDSDCPNPYCDYMLTEEDFYAIEHNNGMFHCPNCGWEANFANLIWDTGQRTRTHTGMSPKDMGQIGESVVKEFAKQQGEIPGLGKLEWTSPTYKDPIDLVLGPYAIEVKTLHSESFPRFKIGGIEGAEEKKSRSQIVQEKQQRTQDLSQQLGMPLEGGIVGVRLNFYTNRADLFFMPEFKDRMMTNMQYIGQFDFSHLNPFSRPEEVPVASQLPDQGWTGDDDIPF